MTITFIAVCKSDLVGILQMVQGESSKVGPH